MAEVGLTTLTKGLHRIEVFSGNRLPHSKQPGKPIGFIDPHEEQ